MLSRIFIRGLFFAIAALSLTGCGIAASSLEGDDNIIGVSIDEVSSPNPPNEAEANHIVLFDKTVRRIHQFDLTKMIFVRSHAVQSPEKDHFVLYNNVGNYTIDLSHSGLTIFNRFGQAHHNPVNFLGTPRSAAFHRNLGILAVYDDLMSVALLKLDSIGNVTDTWVAGSNILNNLTISSGDINEQGKLILSLNDDSLVVMDIEQSITQKSWVISTPRFSTTLSQIKWLAPVPGSPNQILIKDSSKVTLMDLNTQTALDSYSVSQYSYLGSFKSKVPHLISSQNGQLKLIYAHNGALVNKNFYWGRKQPYAINQSILDLDKDQWSFVEAQGNDSGWYNTKSSKTYRRYRVSDLLALHSQEIDANVQTQLGDNYLFNLFPSELGYATRQELGSPAGSLKEIKLFNVPYVKK